MYGEIVGAWSDDDPQREPASAMGGDLRDGCLPLAELELVGGGDPLAAQDLRDAALRLGDTFYSGINEASRDPRYAAALADWTACMDRLGIDAELPDGIARQIRDAQRPTAAHLATATADAECRSSTRLSEIGNELFDVAVQAYFTEHPTLVDGIRTVVNAVTARVEQFHTTDDR